MENIQNIINELKNSNEVELQFFSKWKYKKFFIYQKDKVVSEYYHTLLVKEWIAYKEKQQKYLQDSILKKLQDSKLLDTGITLNILSFVNGKEKEYYEIDYLDELYFDSFESAIFYLANAYKVDDKGEK